MVVEELKKIKLLRVTTISNSLGRLLRGQLRFMNKHMKVSAVCSNSDRIKIIEEREGILIHPINMKRKISIFSDLVSLIKMFVYLQKVKPDIIHSHTPKAGLISMVAGYFAGVPLRLHTVAGMPLEIQTGSYRKLLEFAEKITYKFAVYVYPNSYGLYNFILENKLCKRSKLKVIGKGSSNGIDLGHFNPIEITEDQDILLKSQYGISREDKVFLFIGRIVPDKGIEELVKAWKKLISSNDNVKLLLVGRKENLYPLSTETISLIDEEESIIDCGYQNDVRPYLSIAEIFVFPSYREGLPNVLLQAGAFGLAAIASEINGNTDIIKHEENGLLIKKQNIDSIYKAMDRVCKDEQLVQNLSKTARSLILENYDNQYLWDKLLQEYMRQLDIKIGN